MKSINSLVWSAVLAATLISAGCATPTRLVKHVTYYPSGTTETLAMTQEAGWQLWVGERHDVASARIAASDIGKADIVALGGTAMIVGGMMSGNVPTAALGALTTLADAYFTKSTPNTAVASTAAALTGATVTPTPTPTPLK